MTSPLPPVPILIALQAPDKEGLWGLDQEVPGVSAQGLPGKMVDLRGSWWQLCLDTSKAKPMFIG